MFEELVFKSLNKITMLPPTVKGIKVKNLDTFFVG